MKTVNFISGLAIGAGIATLSFYYSPLIGEYYSRIFPEKPISSKVLISIKGEPSLGSAKAPLTMVEFSDFQCPYCKMFKDEIFPKLKSEFIDTGKLRFIHKDLPLPFHTQAQLAAESARCSLTDARYWKAYSALYNSQNCIECKGPVSIVSEANKGNPTYKLCVKNGTYVKKVKANIAEARLIGVNGTPGFVIGPTMLNGHRGMIIEGVMPWPEFRSKLNKMLIELRDNNQVESQR
jgi:protein-disulfide isomerase